MKKKRRRLGDKLTVASSFAEAEQQDRECWHKQTPQACLRALQLMRRINYGKAADRPIVRILEVVQSSFCNRRGPTLVLLSTGDERRQAEATQC